MTLDFQYKITVASPCTVPATVVSRVNRGTLYEGTSPNGDIVIMQLLSGAWHITVFSGDPTSSCYPNHTFVQDTPDPKDPIGSYDNGDASVAPI